MPLIIVTSPRFADHLTPPGHPERVERFEVMQALASEFRTRGGRVVDSRPASDDELARIHDREYISLIRETAGRAVALDADTFTSPDTYEVACLAAGAAITAVDRVLDGDGRRALVMVRPPGHHAERNRAMGGMSVPRLHFRHFGRSISASFVRRRHGSAASTRRRGNLSEA